MTEPQANCDTACSQGVTIVRGNDDCWQRYKMQARRQRYVEGLLGLHAGYGIRISV